MVIASLSHACFAVSYVVWNTFITQMYPNEIRGILGSFLGIISSLALPLYSTLLEKGFKAYGTKFPYFIACLADASLALIIFILGMFGIFGVKKK